MVCFPFFYLDLFVFDLDTTNMSEGSWSISKWLDSSCSLSSLTQNFEMILKSLPTTWIEMSKSLDEDGDSGTTLITRLCALLTIALRNCCQQVLFPMEGLQCQHCQQRCSPIAERVVPFHLELHQGQGYLAYLVNFLVLVFSFSSKYGSRWNG